MTGSQNPFVWYELVTSDPDAARGFYGHVAGWDAQITEMAGPPYTLFGPQTAPVAGMIDQKLLTGDSAGCPTCWTGFVGVADVDAAAAEAKRLGGSITVPPRDIPNVGRFAVIQDPQGAALALFRGAQEPQCEPPAPETPGRFGWHELLATDGVAAFAFYAALFGWQKSTAVDMGAMGTYQLFSIGGRDAGGMMSRPPAVPGPFWLYYINVPAISAAIARVQERGGTVMNGPMEVPGGTWIAQCRDPQGAAFALAAPQR
jgi:predicted enzyme related to lactoylglutathione lyase